MLVLVALCATVFMWCVFNYFLHVDTGIQVYMYACVTMYVVFIQCIFEVLNLCRCVLYRTHHNRVSAPVSSDGTFITSS